MQIIEVNNFANNKDGRKLETLPYLIITPLKPTKNAVTNPNMSPYRCPCA